MIFGWPSFKIICDTPIFYKLVIENQVSDYRLLGASSFFFSENYLTRLDDWMSIIHKE
jgi:hypothetical protein